jgi:hypothetical protein
MPQLSRYAPEFSIRINGEPLPAALRASIGNVSYQTGIKGADSVDFTIGNPGLRWLGHPLLAVDNGLALSMGYAGEPLEEVFVGEISGVEPSFPSGGMPTIRITAHDFLQRLQKGTKDRGFIIDLPSINNFPLPDAVIASLVSAENLLIPYPDPIGGALSVLMTIAAYVVAPTLAQKGARRQTGQSDFTMLSKLAQENGWEMYIDHTLEPHGYVLRFQGFVQDYSPSLSLKYGASLIEFTPRLSTIGDVASVQARVWIETLRIELVISVAWDYDRAAFDLRIYPDLIGELPAGTEKGTLSIKPVGLAQSLQQFLTELLPRLNNRLTGSGSTIGDLRIRAGRVINLEGLGEEFGGLYRITSATHAIDGSGFRTSFGGRKEVWFGSIPVPQNASGLLRVQGINVG